MNSNLVYQTFKFSKDGWEVSRELSLSHPAYEKRIIKFDFEDKKFKPIKEDCKSELELEEAVDYATKMNNIVSVYGIEIVWTDQTGKVVRGL
jgi:hypothetical protein